MDLQLDGKVAVVTGGSKGIGFYTAKTLLLEGCHVVICARGEKQLQIAASLLQEETGKAVSIVRADITKKEDCEAVIAEAIKRYGQLDIVINNASTSCATNFEMVTDELWQDDLNLKLFGTIRIARAALSHLKERTESAIVNVVSSMAKTPPANSLPTTVSRGAGLAMTNAMSKDLAQYNIRVNAVCIGLVRSEQIEQSWQKHYPKHSWEQYSAMQGENIPLGRIGEAQEAANVIAFLASPAASYVTGTAVNVDGGSAPAL